MVIKVNPALCLYYITGPDTGFQKKEAVQVTDSYQGAAP